MSKIIYNDGKWDGIWDKPKYQKIRDKILESFKDLTFVEEGHKYFLHGKEITCVSNVVHQFQEHFDSRTKAKETYERNYDNVDSKYYHMLPEEIEASWKLISEQACEHGTERHLFAENLFYYYTKQYNKIAPELQDRLTEDGGFKAIYPKEEAAAQFYMDLPRSFIPILPETKVYDEELGYSGTFDLLCYYDAELDGKNANKSGLVVLDWKGLPLDTPILTNNGWKTMGTLTLEDKVYDKQGKLVKIKHISEVHYNPCYKITFDNGSSIVCDEDHRWEVFKTYNIEKRDFFVETTKEIFNNLKNEKTSKKRSTKSIYRIDINKPLEGDYKMDIDPYVFGVWLGDGHSASGMVTNMYQEIFDEIERRGYKVGKDVSGNGAGKACSRTIFGLISKLRKHNLIKNKHIPYEFLTSSIEDRWDILRGLMDTDGYYHPTRKRYILSTTRESQAQFCEELLGSLGIKSSTILYDIKFHGKIIQGYDVCFYTEKYPFLIRKIDVKPLKSNKRTFYNIKKIEPTEMVPTKCIEVDSKTGTFLYGHNFMVTHNTNKDLYKNFNGKKLLYPFDELLDMPLSIYRLQLSLYQQCIEKIGLKVIGRRLMWLRPNGTYDKIPLESYVEELVKALKKY